MAVAVAAIAAGLMGAGSYMGGKEANKPKKFTTSQTLVPFGGNEGIGMTILNNILQSANQQFSQGIGPTSDMDRAYQMIRASAQAPPWQQLGGGGGGLAGSMGGF
jgi:hypothetical protein